MNSNFSLMPAEFEDAELPEDSDKLNDSPEDTDDKDDEETSGDDTKAEDESGEEPPDELTLLKTRLETLETQSRNVEDLRRSVGRIQSAIDKLDKAGPNTDLTKLQSSITEEFGNVHDLLAQVVANADDTVYPAEFKQRILGLRDEARKRATADSLRTDVETQIREALAKITGKAPGAGNAPASADNNSAKSLEDDIVAEIRDYGLDDTEFDWSAASAILASKGPAATRKWFREQIAEKQAEQAGATRRQERKASAGKGSPKASGGAQSEQERIRTGKAPLGDQIEYAKKMGWIS